MSESTTAFDMVQALADEWDRRHEPKVSGMQPVLDGTEYLALNDNERVHVTRATAAHTEEWFHHLKKVKAREGGEAWGDDTEHAVKVVNAAQLVKIQMVLDCSMWEAVLVQGPMLLELRFLLALGSRVRERRDGPTVTPGQVRPVSDE
jgi:hypothetical protein